MLRPGLRGYEQARHVGNVHGGHLEVVRPQPACAREAVDRVMGDLPVQVERLEQRGQVRLDPGDRSRRKVRLGPEVAPHVVGRDLRDVEVTREPLGELVVGALVGADRALREAAAVAVAEEVVRRPVEGQHGPDDDLRLAAVKDDRRRLAHGCFQAQSAWRERPTPAATMKRNSTPRAFRPLSVTGSRQTKQTRGAHSGQVECDPLATLDRRTEID